MLWLVPLFGGLGVACAATALLLLSLAAAAERVRSSPAAPPKPGPWVQPRAQAAAFAKLLVTPLGAGLACGLAGLAAPGVLFQHNEPLAHALMTAGGPRLSGGLRVPGAGGPMPLGPALQLLGAKVGLTALCVQSGLVGGFFKPSLLIGAATGIDNAPSAHTNLLLFAYQDTNNARSVC